MECRVCSKKAHGAEVHRDKPADRAKFKALRAERINTELKLRQQSDPGVTKLDGQTLAEIDEFISKQPGTGVSDRLCGNVLGRCTAIWRMD